jgi:uncharacterized 2Fe-2S/4Fe-4S cluster protein (DUF4445 family)
MATFTVVFEPSGASASVDAPATIHDAAQAAGLTVHAPCGGQGRCGRCLVRAYFGVGEPTGAEKQTLNEQELAEGWRLACQAQLTGDARVRVPDTSLVSSHRIAVEGTGRATLVEPNVQKLALRLPAPSVDDPRADLNRVLDAVGAHLVTPAGVDVLRLVPTVLRSSHYQATAVLCGSTLTGLEPGDTSDEAYGAAVDIGTTTVVLYLVHLPTGQVVQVASDLNPQAQYGDDLVSRITVATTQPDGLSRLSEAICSLIDELIGRAASAAGIGRERIYEISVVGNTCMCHLFLGLSPVGLAALPFVPAFRGAQSVRACELGLAIHPEGRVYVTPSIGGFVGADTVGVIVASELDLADGPRAAIDIGTNGEIVVSRDGELYACSTAAGPAFEGARIRQGMRAARGAIDAVTIGEEVAIHVIGHGPPIGLCGSGLVDAVAGLVRAGVVDARGRLLPPEELPSVPEQVKRRVVQNESGPEFVLAWGEEAGGGRPVSITARDVRELQLAKGAIFAGLSLLLDLVELSPYSLDRLLLAGAFGNYIRRESAMAIGLVPNLPEERIESVGNAAGLGARLVLSSVSLRRRAEEISRRVQHVELAEQEGFYDRFAEAMALRPLPEGS